ncbi:Nicotinamide-nucleotide amidohydrolase PncC [bioreactor metagenome]|uniref:Nicotinamide-nucleotide amidohydrolase PncC n=1 Tax=bioreactor metagenome TaxID=1076179 RepID=A0A645F2B4_9ZZZZ
MAKGALRVLGSDLAVAVTGVAGPETDDRGNQPGLVYVALADREGCIVREIKAGRGRGRVRTMGASYALDLVRRKLTDQLL